MILGFSVKQIAKAPSGRELAKPQVLTEGVRNFKSRLGSTFKMGFTFFAP